MIPFPVIPAERGHKVDTTENPHKLPRGAARIAEGGSARRASESLTEPGFAQSGPLPESALPAATGALRRSQHLAADGRIVGNEND